MGATIAGGVPAQGPVHHLTTLAMVTEAFLLEGELDRAAIHLAGAQALAPSADLVAERQGVAFLSRVTFGHGSTTGVASLVPWWTAGGGRSALIPRGSRTRGGAAACARGILARDVAEHWFARARAAYQRRPMPFEQARTLLGEGEASRRARCPDAGRRSLPHALTLFSGLGARPWLVHTMIELAASGVRADARNATRPSAGHALSGPVSGGSRECRLGRMRGATRLHMTGRAGSRGRGEVRGPWSRTGR